MFGLYSFLDWNGSVRVMRASSIHKRVMNDSKKSNFGWIASASDLVYVCSKENFPKYYAVDIMAAILNCFSVLINSDNIDLITKETDIKAVYYAYNSLFNCDSKIGEEARKTFLTSFLTKITWETHLFLAHRGNTFMEVTAKWQEDKFNELINVENLNFETLKQKLTYDYIATIKNAEKEGLFEKEDSEEQERQMEYIKKMVDDFVETYGTASNPKKIIRLNN